MKKILSIFLVSFFPGACSSSLDFEEAIKKIEKPDRNIIMALRDLNKNCKEFHENKDLEKDFEILVKVCESTSCLEYFSIELKKEKYTEALSLMKEKEAAFDLARLKRVIINPKYKKIISSKMESITESGMNNCHFEIDLNALSIPKVATKKKLSGEKSVTPHLFIKCPLVNYD